MEMPVPSKTGFLTPPCSFSDVIPPSHKSSPLVRVAKLLGAVVLLILGLPSGEGSHDAQRLYDDLMKKNGYNKMARPVANHSHPVLIGLGLKLTQIIDVVSFDYIGQNS